MRSDDRVENLTDGALLGLGQRFDLLQLLRDLRLWPALTGAACGGHADQFFDRHLQHAGDGGQHRRGDASGAAFVVGHGLLSDAQFLGEVGLGEAERLASFRDLAAELAVELRILHGVIGRVDRSVENKVGSGPTPAGGADFHTHPDIWPRSPMFSGGDLQIAMGGQGRFSYVFYGYTTYAGKRLDVEAAQSAGVDAMSSDIYITTSLIFGEMLETPMRLLIIALILMNLVACDIGDRRELGDQRCAPYEQAGVPCELPLVAVLANPKTYESIPITVGGFLAGESSPGVLYSSREMWAIGDRSSSILLSSEDEGVSGDGSRYKFSYVVVSGALDGIGQRQSRQPNLVFSVSRVVRVYEPDDFSDRELRIIEGGLPVEAGFEQGCS